MTIQSKEPRILVVNESLNLLNLFHDILDDGHGYEIEISNFTFENVDSVERLHPDLIILDFSTTEHKEAWQLLQMVKMHPPTESIPVLACVLAVHPLQGQEEYLRRQNVRLLYKPFQSGDLLEAVRLMLASSST